MFRSLLSSMSHCLCLAPCVMYAHPTHFSYKQMSSVFNKVENNQSEQSNQTIHTKATNENVINNTAVKTSLSSSVLFQNNVFNEQEIRTLSDDIVTESVVDVSVARDLHGPWLIMTDDLQGELFIDHDGFVFYEPAGSLGYGIGKLQMIAANNVGTAFTLELESYSYDQHASLVPLYGIKFEVTGMVQKITTKSSSYTTFILSGVWMKTDKNAELELPLDTKEQSKANLTGTTTNTAANAINATNSENVLSVSQSMADAAEAFSETSTSTSATSEALSQEERSYQSESGALLKQTGQFTCVKITPWQERNAASERYWQPDANLINVFKQVFPQELELNSHLKREKEAELHISKNDPLNRGVHNNNNANINSQSESVRDNVIHMNLAPYAVGSVPGVYYIPDYISAMEEVQMLERIRNTPDELKQKLVKRTAQEWGCTMCDKCKQSFVSDANVPPWIQQFMDMLVYDGLYTPTTFPNSVRIHEYNKGDGIGPHCDGPIYVPIVTVLSMASTTVMNFYPRRSPYVNNPMEHYKDTFNFDEGEIGKQCPLQSVVMEPRSLLVFSGIAYYYYPHGVSDKEVDILTPEKVGDVVNRHLLHDKDIMEVQRQYRVSITTRNLLTRCTHQQARAQYNMKRAWYVYNHQHVPSPLFTSSRFIKQNDTLENINVDNNVNADANSINKKTNIPTNEMLTHITNVPSGKMEQTGMSSLGTAIDATFNNVNSKIDNVLIMQRNLADEIRELKSTLTQLEIVNKEYRDSTSLILNTMSSSVLELDSKADEIIEFVRRKKEK